MGNTILAPTGIKLPTLRVFAVGSGDYTLTLDDEIIIVTDAAYDVIFDEDLGFPDGWHVYIKNKTSGDVTVRIKAGDIARFEDTLTEIILTSYEYVHILKWGANYYKI